MLRGGWQGAKPGYALSYQAVGDSQATSEDIKFSGLDDELLAFVQQVSVHCMIELLYIAEMTS